MLQRALLLGWLGLMLLGGMGCSNSFIPEGRFACRSASECPDDWACVNARCQRKDESVSSVLEGGTGSEPDETPSDAGALEPDALPDEDGGSVEPEAGTPTDAALAADTATMDAIGPDAGLVDASADADAGGCASASDCDDDNPCTEDSCDDRSCRHAAIADCCNRDEECDDGAPCTRDVCSASRHRCERFKIEGCCAAASDCPAVSCSDGSCTDNVCKYTPRSNCCTSNAMCDDQNACTTDTCEAGGLCKNAKIANCCVSSGDCNDGVACTTDTCDNGRCQFTRIAECCTNNADCADSSACTSESCNLNTQRCTRGVKRCDDLDPCTKDSCNPSTGTCLSAPVVCASGCCAAGACVPAIQCGCSSCSPACCVNGICLPPSQCKSTNPIGGGTD